MELWSDPKEHGQVARTHDAWTEARPSGLECKFEVAGDLLLVERVSLFGVRIARFGLDVIEALRWGTRLLPDPSDYRGVDLDCPAKVCDRCLSCPMTYLEQKG